MKKRSLIVAGMLALTLVACKKEEEKKTNTEMNENPLLVEEINTPYGVAPVDVIKDEHYEPAILEAIKMHQAEVDAIVNSTGTQSFENTVLAMEKAGYLLKRI